MNPHIAGCTITPVGWDDPEAGRLRAEQRAEMAVRYQTPDSEPGPAPTADDVAVFLLARDENGAAVGCIGLRPLGGDVAEIKRMYVVPAARGRGLAKQLLAAVEQRAVAAGWTTLRLETGDRQPEAIALYRGAGYVRIPNFGYYAGEATSICFERRLSV